ncbi:MAG: SDR family NAD(P)-dependent oxidoreductase [Phycisphaerales bacterium JB041]
MQDLKGKVAVVTGASKGIGAGIARELAAAGAAVAVNYASDQAGAAAVVAEIERAGGRAVAVPADVSNSGEVTRMLTEVARTLGAIDILVNNAGVYDAMPLEALTEREFHREFNTNVLGPMLVIREALRHFAPGGGSIVNIGSGASRSFPPGYFIYAATKAALDAVTCVLAKELAPRRIRVNSVNPGATLSEGTRAAGLYGTGSEAEKQLVAMTPLGRVGTPEDIARVVVFLASDAAGWVTGELVHASGGLR